MIKSVKIAFLLLSTLLWGQNQLTPETSAQLAAGKETVAILDFEGRGISQMEAQTLTDRLMSEMVNTNAVIMVERNQMEEIMQEQGFQQSGCTTSECAAEVGALLGVQNMVHLVNWGIHIQLMQNYFRFLQEERSDRLVKHIKVKLMDC